jgi:hypothetical protein
MCNCIVLANRDRWNKMHQWKIDWDKTVSAKVESVSLISMFPLPYGIESFGFCMLKKIDKYEQIIVELEDRCVCVLIPVIEHPA